MDMAELKARLGDTQPQAAQPPQGSEEKCELIEAAALASCSGGLKFPWGKWEMSF